MRLDYGTQISPEPISLSIGTIKKPTIRDIAKITFDKFSYFEFLMTMTPEKYYTKLLGEEGKKYWEEMPIDKQNSLDIYDLIKTDENIRMAYLDLLNFFFVEHLIFCGDFLILINNDVEDIINLTQDDIRGSISKDSLFQVLEILQQICCIYSEKSNEKVKYKNSLAKKLYQKIQKAEKEKSKKADFDFSLPNVISSLSNKHPSINYTNVWNLTIFQLMDSFKRTQANAIHEIESTRVSVWGDEKKTFDPTLWYKNEYDKTSQSETTG